MHGDVHDIGVGLEGHLDFPEIVVRVGVVKGETDEARYDRVQLPRVLCGDAGRGRKYWQETQHKRLRARVAQDGCLYPGHGKRRS